MNREIILTEKQVDEETLFIEKSMTIYGYDSKGEFVFKRLSKTKVYDTKKGELSYWFVAGTNLKYYNSSQEKEKIGK